MKRIGIFLLLVLCMTNNNAQRLFLGIRDNQFANISFMLKKHLLIGYEQSLLNVKPKEQNGRLFIGYEYGNPSFLARGIIYTNHEYSGNWSASGVSVYGIYSYKRIAFDITLNPNYDTNLNFDFCYNGEVSGVIWKTDATGENIRRISLFASYGNIPEYREACKNIKIGAEFTCGNLWVKPAICLPNIDKGCDYMRVLCSFGWNIKFKSKRVHPR